MNRADRRSYMKQGVSKETVNQLDKFNSPCSIAEAVQIARATAEDVVEDYHKSVTPVQVAISMQVEILKGMLVEAGVISEEKFRELYVKQAEEFNSMINASASEELEDAPKMSAKVDNIEVTVER